ncbi:carbon-nitrogen hydrolase family protein [Dactylosporangium sp. CA-092794]|uniref:carbon-nitrogen hydrolase family protein n=1 Tax=Dactylosporangium sp. CA-092794 TaxID=3239929 RepID=UPI003D8EB1D4
MTFPLIPPPAAPQRRRDVRVSLVQAAFEVATQTHDPRDRNLAHAITAIRAAARSGAELVVIGELFLQGPGSSRWAAYYSTRLDGTDPHVHELEKLAAELNVTVLIGCTSYGPALDVHNTALVISPGAGLCGTYHKAHLASFPYRHGLSAEQSYYAPGADLTPIAAPIGRLGVHICYDIFFPEAARTQALLGADLLINLAAAGEGFEAYWDHLTWARATENGMWYLMSSVVGDSPERGYFGGSRIIAPDGTTTARAKDTVEDIVTATIDLDAAQQMRSQLHMFSVRQPRLYLPISRARRGGHTPGRQP